MIVQCWIRFKICNETVIWWVLVKENKMPSFLQNPFASLGNLKKCWEICSGLSSRVIIWERRCGKACTGLAEVGGHPADIAIQTAEPTSLRSSPLFYTSRHVRFPVTVKMHLYNLNTIFPVILNIHCFCLHYGVDPCVYIPLRLNPMPQCRFSHWSGVGRWCGSDRPSPGVVPHTSAAAIWDLWHNSTRKRTW